MKTRLKTLFRNNPAYLTLLLIIDLNYFREPSDDEREVSVLSYTYSPEID